MQVQRLQSSCLILEVTDSGRTLRDVSRGYDGDEA